ncbi:cell division topological specificity factor MinE [Acinetobacter schindleri]|jgi:cell division topological specificity factor|uniref:Cell division topological specificity factor n=1 Tax=Acinetobacter schindleri TaxID=108981 RepID=A0AAE6WWV1_9GAMM|nr:MULTISPECIES: cell division topological specificity factor MinE [Acinetobacter]ATO18498.1 cell division topological specificity factor MinE [Acinetobacter sp. LoGeW2-3]MCO8066716.1 cell division topological specificity factor MinE [Acinetobacter schindleri]MEB5929291.1 cell division topological specificity factor MinE [Acinetobacter schindleri]OIJ38998.1 cell division topological specificity factor MinE [Acinetobacter sp. LCT-H3]QIC60553.1 cell division topological specificity factor MinE [
MAGFWSKLFSSEDKPSSAQTAKDRLKVIVASEQGLGRRLSQDKIDMMKKEIMQVVNRYVRGVDEQHIQMQVRSEANIEMLEMNINLPEER